MVKKDYVTQREFDKFSNRTDKTLDKIVNNDLHHLDLKLDKLGNRLVRIEVKVAFIVGGIAVLQFLAQRLL